MRIHRLFCLALAICILCGLTACGRKGEETSSGDAASSQASDSSAADGTASGDTTDTITIPFVVVPELTVKLIDMVQVINVNEGSTLNVREGPGTDYTSIGSAQPGERFVYLGDADGWRKIQFGETEAYVSAEYSEVISVAAN